MGTLLMELQIFLLSASVCLSSPNWLPVIAWLCNHQIQIWVGSFKVKTRPVMGQ